MKLTVVILFVFVAFAYAQMPSRPLNIEVNDRPLGDEQERNKDRVQGRPGHFHDRSNKMDRSLSSGKFDFPMKQQVENSRKTNEGKIGIQITE